jgi:hypothetical protein
MHPLRPRRRTMRFWRPGPEPASSKLSKGRRSTSRRLNRFSPLEAWRAEPVLSPLHKIPTLRPWLATREAQMPAMHAAV